MKIRSLIALAGLCLTMAAGASGQSIVTLPAGALGCPGNGPVVLVGVSSTNNRGAAYITFKCAAVDPATLVVDLSTTPPTLRVVVMPPVAAEKFQDDDPVCANWPTLDTFALTQTPNPASSLVLTVNGLTLKVGVDYAVVGNAVTFLFNKPGVVIGGAGIPIADTVRCSYRF